MTATAVEKKYGEMNLEELDVRGAELRAALGELSEGERSDDTNQQMGALLREVDVLDRHFTLARHRAHVEEDRKRAERDNSLAPYGANALHRVRAMDNFTERLFASEAMKAFIAKGLRASDGSDRLSLEVSGFIDPSVRNIIGNERAVTEWGGSGPGNAATGAINTLLPVGQPIAPLPRQARLAMRDLIPSQPTTLSQVPYVRELNPTATELGASAVAEGNTKPDASPNFVGEIAAPTVIAVSMSPTKQLWEDAPLVVAYINQRLPYLTRFKEDAELIAGSGTWPDIEGIKNVPGVQAQAAVNTDYAQTIGMSIADVELVDGTATGCVMNPTDAWTMFTKRAAGGSGTFDAGTPFSVSAVESLTVWGLPTVRSRAYASGSALVGDFAHGAMILDREGVNVQIYPQHSDYAVKNQILVLCEERVGLAVWRPDYFVVASL